jgi:hypothetical protein
MHHGVRQKKEDIFIGHSISSSSLRTEKDLYCIVHSAKPFNNKDPGD